MRELNYVLHCILTFTIHIALHWFSCSCYICIEFNVSRNHYNKEARRMWTRKWEILTYMQSGIRQLESTPSLKCKNSVSNNELHVMQSEIGWDWHLCKWRKLFFIRKQPGYEQGLSLKAWHWLTWTARSWFASTIGSRVKSFIEYLNAKML